MFSSFKENQHVHTSLNKSLHIIKFLGAGGQGEVYEVKINGQRMALKWYFLQSGSEKQKLMIQQLITIGKPDKRFLWPTELVEIDKKKSFGYLMPLRPPQYSNIVDLMKRRIEPTFDAVITACIQLADSFYRLHELGLCYRDISFGNFFFYSRTGDILICDNDNVTSNLTQDTGVLGTPRFMAPEVVRGISKPNKNTDLFSLSVLIFYMLMMHHPLEGRMELKIKCFDLPAMTRLYGEKPTFIFDPYNQANRPVPGYHDNAIVFWPIYTERIRKLFTDSFVNGAKYPGRRVDESIWRLALVTLKNSIVLCDCGMENFYDIDLSKSGKKNHCWNCKRMLHQSSVLKLGDEAVVLNANTKIYGHHLMAGEKFNFKKILGTVVPHPKIKNVFGLKNMSHTAWEVKTQAGKKYTVDFGKSILIEAGTTINFGEVVGVIRRG